MWGEPTTAHLWFSFTLVSCGCILSLQGFGQAKYASTLYHWWQEYCLHYCLSAEWAALYSKRFNRSPSTSSSPPFISRQLTHITPVWLSLGCSLVLLQGLSWYLVLVSHSGKMNVEPHCGGACGVGGGQRGVWRGVPHSWLGQTNMLEIKTCKVNKAYETTDL
jgi:hypothetical protein